MKLSDYVLQRVAEEGVRHVFMVPGGGAMHLNDSLGRRPDLTFVCNLHEQASAIAAETYAKATGNLGVALVTSGPGGTNALTGVAGAWLDSTPCLFLSGQVKRSDLAGPMGLRSFGVQEVDIVSMVRPITKYTATVLDPATIREHLDRALHEARTGRPGPVWLDIPLDVQAATIDPESLPAAPPSPSVPSLDLKPLARRVLQFLNESERPVLLAGNGIRLAHAEAAFRLLVERLDVPVLTTWLGIDLLEDADPRFVGRPGAVAPRGANFVLQNSDLLLSIGARLDLVLTGYSHEHFARSAHKIVVDIDPAELKKMRCPIDLPVAADAGAFIEELIRQSDSSPRVRDRTAWWARCRDWRRRYPVVLPEHLDRDGLVSVYALSDALSDELVEGDAIVSGSSGAGIEIFLLALRVKSRQRVFHTTSLGAMGFGIPAAIGACLGSGGRRTVVVDGDGGFQLNIQELETIARLNLPIKFFVLDNAGYASIRASQQNHFGRLTGADATSGLTLPDVEAVARAYGLATARIDNQACLKRSLREILDSDGPVVCRVRVLPDEDRLPRISSKLAPNGSMVSTPLEDLYPYLDRDEFRSNMLVPILPESEDGP
jgi:acetolactate synthase I/II/III large subunit